MQEEIDVSPRIIVIIPVLNEETAIFHLIRKFTEIQRNLPLDILVIDGHSTDGTVKVAKKAGAKVMIQGSHGKGLAMIEAVDSSVHSEVCVFIDGDGTYLPCDIGRIVKPVLSGEADMIIGSRINKNMEKGAILPLNIIGNILYNLVVRVAFKTNVSDMLSGYRAVRTEAFKELKLKSRNFEIEVEMTAKALAKGLKVAEVPITYLRRRGKPTKLKPFRDGTLIFRALISEIINKKTLT